MLSFLTSARRARSSHKPRLEMLEDRSVPATFSAAELHGAGEYMRELINTARAAPAATAAGFGIDLNEGLAPGTISPAPKAPLAPNSALFTALDRHLATWVGQFTAPDARNP